MFTERRFLVSLLLACSMMCQAQVIQQGMVMEYLERQQETPLDKVELSVASESYHRQLKHEEDLSTVNYQLSPWG